VFVLLRLLDLYKKYLLQWLRYFKKEFI